MSSTANQFMNHLAELADELGGLQGGMGVKIGRNTGLEGDMLFEPYGMTFQLRLAGQNEVWIVTAYDGELWQMPEDRLYGELTTVNAQLAIREYMTDHDPVELRDLAEDDQRLEFLRLCTAQYETILQQAGHLTAVTPGPVVVSPLVQTTETATEVTAPRANDVTLLLAHLNTLIGADELTDELRGTLLSRHLRGLLTLPAASHNALPAYEATAVLQPMWLIGSAGTGKSYAVQLMAQTLAAAGLLAHGRVQEVDMIDLAAREPREVRMIFNNMLFHPQQPLLGGVLVMRDADRVIDAAEAGDAIAEEVLATLKDVAEVHAGNLLVVLTSQDKEHVELANEWENKAHFPRVFTLRDHTAASMSELWLRRRESDGYGSDDENGVDYLTLAENVVAEATDADLGRLAIRIYDRAQTDYARRVAVDAAGQLVGTITSPMTVDDFTTAWNTIR